MFTIDNMSKIRVHIKKRSVDGDIPTLEELSGQLPITDLVKLCRKYNIIIRGGKKNICDTLKKKLYQTQYRETNPVQIVGRTFIRYLFWKLGRCDLESKCNNEHDFYTSAPVSTIPICYRFYTQNQAQVHGYDIRSLVYYRNNGTHFRNPYTDQLFTESEIGRLDRKLVWLERLGYPVTHFSHSEQSQGQARWTDCSIKQYTVNIFSSINDHQYVDHEWFDELTFDGLKTLYHELYEIWHYRLPMQNDHKESITSSIIFGNWESVRQYQTSMANKLRIELLKNIERLVTDGATEDHRKSGCYIFMLGLVLVSEPAATSHPCMYHAAYYDD